MCIRDSLKILPEQAVLVPDAVAGQRHALRGGGIQKARGQAAQAAVAQRRVLDLFKHCLLYTSADGEPPI